MGGGASVDKNNSREKRSKEEVLVIEDVTTEPKDASSIRSLPVSGKQLSIGRDENPVQLYISQDYQSRNSRRSVIHHERGPSRVSSRSSVINENDPNIISCPHCGHRRRCKIPPLSPGSQPPWIMQEPVTGQQVVDMDEYDSEALMKKVTDDYGRLPRSYDYVPVVKIIHPRKKLFSDDDDFQLYTHTVVARRNHDLSPLRTPLSNIQHYQKLDNPRNKPFTDELLAD